MLECFLAVDAGGTSLKYALMTPAGEPVLGGTMAQVGTEGGVLPAFRQAAAQAARQARGLNHRIVRAGVCCPGPFDFALGQSRMRHKWPDAYETPIAPVLRSVLGPLPVAFLHDSSAYTLGEGLLGAGRGAPCLGGLMLGTGFGFGLMRSGRVLVVPSQSPRISVWNMPYGKGTVEDAVSRRALRSRYAALRGLAPEQTPDVREIAGAAFAGEAEAARVFTEMGRDITAILWPILEREACDRLVVGGQIARSAALFLPLIRLPVEVRVAEHMEDAALRGTALYCALGHEATMEEGNDEHTDTPA